MTIVKLQKSSLFLFLFSSFFTIFANAAQITYQGNSWSMTCEDAQGPSAMIITVRSDGINATLLGVRTEAGENSPTIDWGDGTENSGVYSHLYSTAGDYDIKIKGKFWRSPQDPIPLTNAALIDIKQWGGSPFPEDLSYFFQFEDKFETMSAIDSPDFSKVKTLAGMFDNAINFNGPLNFDVSNVENTSNMFNWAVKFNQPLNFNTSNITNMAGMFRFAYAFNQPLNFNTENVSNMANMLYSAEAFNQPINFNTSNVTNMVGMFA